MALASLPTNIPAVTTAVAKRGRPKGSKDTKPRKKGSGRPKGAKNKAQRKPRGHDDADADAEPAPAATAALAVTAGPAAAADKTAPGPTAQPSRESRKRDAAEAGLAVAAAEKISANAEHPSGAPTEAAAAPETAGQHGMAPAPVVHSVVRTHARVAGPGPNAVAVARRPLPDLAEVQGCDAVFQSPGEVRASLRAAQTRYGASVAALARVAGAPYPSFRRFMTKTGEFGGDDSSAYHPAADLVEKLRVATGEPKSKKRKALEAEMVAEKLDQPFLGHNPPPWWWGWKCGRELRRDSLGRQVVN